MKKCKKLLTIVMSLSLVIAMMFFTPIEFRATMTEADLIYVEEGQKFQVVFHYDVEKPVLEFVSPSGITYSEATSQESDLKVVHGTGWSTYEIDNAESGQWKLRYDKKNNQELSFSVNKVIMGIAIQEFSVTAVQEDIASVSFLVEKNGELVSYDYVIYAVTEFGTTELASGSADTGEQKQLEVNLDISSSNSCVLRLDVLHRGEVETADSISTEPFKYQNPNAPEAMENFWAYVDVTNAVCELDWSEYSNASKYLIEVIADGDVENPVLHEILEDGITETFFYYPVGTKKIDIKIHYFSNDTISAPVSKTIDLEKGEYLKTIENEVTGLSVLPLQYSVSQKSTLNLTLNGVSSTHEIEGVGELSLALLQGENKVEATLIASNNVVYKISKEIYHTWLTPTIELFEDLNGRVFYSDTLIVSGKVGNGEKLLINNVEVPIVENKTFTYEISLVEGSNSICLEAFTSEGISTQLTFSVIKSVEKLRLENTMDWMIPIWVVIAVTVLLIGFFVVLKGKKKKAVKTEKKMKIETILRIIGWGIASLLVILEGVGIFVYVQIYKYTHSMEFVQLAQTSMTEAAKYLEYESMIKTALLRGFGILLILLAARIIFVFVRNKLGKRKF